MLRDGVMSPADLRARALWGLTKSESRVAQLVANGYANGEIARMLWVTERTVKFHVGRILAKVGVRNRVELARAWILQVEQPNSESVAGGSRA
jgi:DNA-binding CsgD family transcriptional regulator